MGDLIAELVGWVAESLVGDVVDRRRQRRARRRLDAGFLRCDVLMVSGKIGGLTREGAAVELELLDGAVVCRRRDDRSRAIRLADVTLDPTSARSFHTGDPVTSADDDRLVRWRLITPTATLQVVASGSLMRGAYARVHPGSAVASTTAPPRPADPDAAPALA